VGHGVSFHLDRCGRCGGIWFDRNEWEILEANGLHDDVHLVFSEAWQAAVRQSDQQQVEEDRLRVLLGDESLARIQQIKQWLDGHPKKSQLYAYLLHRRLDSSD
jgi:Zn-finger nucleic acid-binding protein